MKKYFQLSGTINGSVFLVRYFFSSLLSYLMGFGAGFSIGLENYFMAVIFGILALGSIYFNLTTTFKRVNALIPKNIIEIMSFVVIGNLVVGLSNVPTVVAVVNLVFLIFNMFLIFKNSNIEKHEG